MIKIITLLCLSACIATVASAPQNQRQKRTRVLEPILDPSLKLKSNYHETVEGLEPPLSPGSDNLAERTQIQPQLPGTGNLAEKRIPDFVLQRLYSGQRDA